MKPNRFLLFGGTRNCPDGGWNDLIQSFPTRQQAEAGAIHLLSDGEFVWYHIVDFELGKVVARGALTGYDHGIMQ